MTQVDETAPRSRDRDRRSKIVAAATRLFRERGFHAVGIDEIGTAAGITGPGVYRHFGGKDDLLTSVLETATDDLWTDLSPDDHPSLEALVRSHVAYAVRHADAIELWYQEGRNLPAEARAAQRRLQRIADREGQRVDQRMAAAAAQLQQGELRMEGVAAHELGVQPDHRVRRHVAQPGLQRGAVGDPVGADSGQGAGGFSEIAGCGLPCHRQCHMVNGAR